MYLMLQKGDRLLGKLHKSLGKRKDRSRLLQGAEGRQGTNGKERAGQVEDDGLHWVAWLPLAAFVLVHCLMTRGCMMCMVIAGA